MNYLTLLVAGYFAILNSKLHHYNLANSEWNAFKLEFGKEYTSQEVEELRKAIYSSNKHDIEEFNFLHSQNLGFSLDVNHLADHSKLDMREINGYRTNPNRTLKNSLRAEEFLQAIYDDNSTVPDSVDWRKTPGRVSRVKNQGSCGSCWAFASTGALEGQEKVRLNQNRGEDLIELSEQNLVDCVKKDYGCNGGMMADAFDFIKEEGGIDDEISYPYEGRNRKCRFRRDKSVIVDGGSAILPEGDEEKLKEVVAKFGPVAVAIDASSLWFQFYRHGVYINKHCGKKADELDHGVLVVGYGTDPKKGDYWIVKNSWGHSYGESGYIRMGRNRNNMCGIATAATVPTF